MSRLGSVMGLNTYLNYGQMLRFVKGIAVKIKYWNQDKLIQHHLEVGKVKLDNC